MIEREAWSIPFRTLKLKYASPFLSVNAVVLDSSIMTEGAS